MAMFTVMTMKSPELDPVALVRMVCIHPRESVCAAQKIILIDCTKPLFLSDGKAVPFIFRFEANRISLSLLPVATKGTTEPGYHRNPDE